MKPTYGGILRTALRGCIVVNLYNGPRNGRSCSSAPTTNMMRPRPSSNAAICIVLTVATCVVHLTSHSARLCDSPRLYDQSKISNPTQTRESPLAVLLQDSGTPHVEHNTKNIISPILYRGPPHSSIKSSATSICQEVESLPTRYCASRPIDPATRDQ